MLAFYLHSDPLLTSRALSLAIIVLIKQQLFP